MIAVITVEVFPAGTTRRESLAYERSQIRRNRLPYNRQHNPDWPFQGAQRAEIEGRDPNLIDRWWWWWLWARRAGFAAAVAVFWFASVAVAVAVSR